MDNRKQELFDFLGKIEENEYDEETADEKLMNLISLNQHDGVLLQCLCTSDGISLLELCSLKHFPLCQEFLLRKALFNPHILMDQCEILTEACRKGYSTVVHLLLLNNVKMSQQPICTPNSPFYIASQKGFVEILETMVNSDPYLIKKDVRKTLLLAACIGGNLNAVKFWFNYQTLPCNEVNIDHKSTAEKYQHNPLYYACKGKHMTVIRYLVDEGFPLSEEICKKFPDTIKKFLLMNYDTSNTQLELNWPHLHLPLLLKNWIEDIEANITVLNISHNKLSCLPPCLPWGLPNLVSLNASKNNLSRIPNPEGDILCQSLKILNLSHNKLKMLCSEVFQIPSITEIYATNNQLVFLTEDEELFHGMGQFFSKSGIIRDCPNLSILNLSFNTLQIFPKVLPQCPNLTKFYASHNQLSSVLDPWSSPLDTLDLSHNLLTEISSSLKNFWASTLRYVNLSYNQFPEISESIVSLYSLTELIISNNNIRYLPCSESWGCINLRVLDLGNNKLGLNTEGNIKRSKIFKATQPNKVELFDLDIPKSVLQNLEDLNLEYNKLTVVPPCISEMKSLVFLNLSGNSGITRLPEELGLLESCKEFYTEGLDVMNVPKEILEEKYGREILRFLQYKLRNSKPHLCMKLSVMGPEGKGKTSLLKALTKGNMKNLQSSPGLSVSTWTIDKKWQIFSSTSSVSSITFNVWEFSKSDKFSDIHNCFISKNSLFLLVWDIRRPIAELEPFLISIESKCKNAVIMLVGTFLDQILRNKEELMKQTLSKIKAMYSKQNMSFTIVDLWLTCPPLNTGVKELAAGISNVAKNMKHNHHKGELFLSRKIPQSYISLAQKIQGIQLNYCFEDEFKKFVEEMEGNDIISHADLQQASIFLHEIGVLLYLPEFDNTSLYFFHPVWLVDLLGKIFTDERLQCCFNQQGKLCLRRARPILDSFLPQEEKLDYTELLEAFGIALRMDRDVLFVPATLLDHPPGINMCSTGMKLVRLIKMCCVPPGFWNQFMIQVMLIIELLSENMFMTYRFSLNNNFRRCKLMRSFNKYGRSHDYQNTQLIYWRKGLIVSYETGNFQVRIRKEGILITVQTLNKDFSMMGILMDELENLTENLFPGLMTDFNTYAVCPKCYPDISDFEVSQDVDHFCIEQCAYVLMTSYSIKCTCGHQILLENLVPELMMMRIPSIFHLDKKEIECLDFIASGVSGSVFVGQYRKQNVALKFYQQNNFHTSQTSRGSSLNVSWKCAKKVIDARNFKDNITEFTEGKLLLQKLHELRHEVLLLSYLKHRCIISLVGFILRPLCMVLELAPMRSLRLVINSHMIKHNGQEVLFPKMLTYRILLQISEGVNYLHQKGITYRDLKTDNILVWSLKLDCKVNVKLSDYNFSRHSTLKGMVTPAGTPGYQAPEILARHTYDEKVDIYAWSMVAYEVQSGLIPFHNLQSSFLISEAVLAKKRPSLEILGIESRFPCLDKLIKLSHEHSPSDRPNAAHVVSIMRKMSFFFLKNIPLKPLTSNKLDAQYLFNNDKGRQMIWLWEGQNEARKYYIIDNTSQSVICNSCFPGSQVICQTNFKKKIWLATQNAEIEILGILNQRYWLEITETVKLPCKASVMLSQEEKDQVYIGLSSGVLMMFQHDPQQNTQLESVSSWSNMSLEISDQPLSTLVIFQNELWVSCGQNIHIICQESFRILQTLNCPLPISGCTFTENGQIFYMFQDSAKVFQFDVASRQRLFVYDFQDLKMVGKIADSTEVEDQNEDNVEENDYPWVSEQPDCLVLSILLVDNALWVARDIGDILIVCTDDGFTHKMGFVIAALKPDYVLPTNERQVGVKGLSNCADKSVFSLVELEDDSSVKTTRICFWEKFSISEIHQIKNHILELKAEEKKSHENLNVSKSIPQF